MMLKKGGILSTLKITNERYLPVYYLQEIIDELGESHLEALTEIDNLNKRIRELEDAIIIMGKSHIEHNYGSKKKT